MERTEPEAVSVAVFAKPPVPGSVKTRLIGCLGAEAAAGLYAAMTRRALALAREAELGPNTLWCWPDAQHPVLIEMAAQFGLGLREQQGCDLGQRMLNCFSVLCPTGPVLLMGTDCPALDVALLQDAARALRQGRDAVFVPAEDGGYVLVGLRRPEPVLFDGLDWGSCTVMDDTRDRLGRLGWKWTELRVLWDVDRPDDVERLRLSGLLNEWFMEMDS